MTSSPWRSGNRTQCRNQIILQKRLHQSDDVNCAYQHYHIISISFQISRHIFTHSNHPLEPPRHTHYRTRKIRKIYCILLLTTPFDSYLHIIIESSNIHDHPWSHFPFQLIPYISHHFTLDCVTLTQNNINRPQMKSPIMWTFLAQKSRKFIQGNMVLPQLFF